MHPGIFLVLALTAVLPFAAAASAEAKPAQTVDFDNTQVNKQLVTYEG